MENLLNLAPPFRKAVVDKYLGTRIGRQELNAEILDDVPGALWNRTMIDADRITPVDSVTPVVLPHFVRVLVAVDPAKEVNQKRSENKKQSDEYKQAAYAETGIVVVGKTAEGHGYLLEDLSFHGTPEEWGRVAVQAYDDWAADQIVYEANQGGEMVAAVLRQAGKSLKEEGYRTADFVPMKAVHATRGKIVRAEPVSQLYEQHKVHHVGYFPELEDQLCEYTEGGNMGYSPDRMDALVWGITELLVGSIAHEGLMDYYRQENEAIKNKLEGKDTYELNSSSMVPMLPPPVNTPTIAYGMSGIRYDIGQDGLFLVKEEDVAPLQSAGFRRNFADAKVAS